MQERAAATIRDLGFRLILTDQDPDCVCRKYADTFIELDTFDADENLRASEDLRIGYCIRAVFTTAADCHGTVARVAKALSLHGIDPEISDLCRFKPRTRALLSHHGIAQPRFIHTEDIEAARRFVEELGVGCVIKSTDNSGSRGFSRLDDSEGLSSRRFEHAVSEGTTGQAIIEELLKPKGSGISEQSVETLWYEGRMYWLNWVDRMFREDFESFESGTEGTPLYDSVAWGVELGHLNPAIHPYALKTQVHDMVMHAGVALGMHRLRGGHILKADIMQTIEGPRIIELTPRLSGGWDSSKSSLRRGGNFVKGALALALGDELDLDLWNANFRFRDESLHVAVLAMIREGQEDCIGRSFSVGQGYLRQEAIENAAADLREEKYVVPME
jgi:hypothetical protein